jgi:heme oxygenase
MYYLNTPDNRQTAIMLQERLKKDTRPDHDTLEASMFVDAIMNGTLSLPQYRKLLTTNYLTHAAFENLLFSTLPLQLADELQITRRRKLPALLMDLEESQMEVPPPSENEDWAASYYNNDPSVLGALYVLEGATLGGHVIVKRLAINPMLNRLDLGFHYYRVYGDDLVPNWKQFCEVLNRQPEAAYPLILAGARRMFAYIASVQSDNPLHLAKP